jgi:hypothetical protein
MNMKSMMIWRPWSAARAQGRNGIAALLFFMQVSLVLWPAAVRAAYRMEQARQKQGLLNELAAMHAMVLPEKHFQPGLSMERVS